MFVQHDNLLIVQIEGIYKHDQIKINLILFDNEVED